MPFNKDDHSNAYDEGYKDGKKGNYYSDLEQSNSHSLFGNDKNNSSSYDAGYADGTRDRHQDCRDKDGKEGCFITTACVQHMGKKDNAPELKTLRSFRDNFITKMPNGQNIISLYYEKSPKIVESISKLDKHEQTQIYIQVYQKITKACTLIDEKKYQEAFALYLETVLDLDSKYNLKNCLQPIGSFAKV